MVDLDWTIAPPGLKQQLFAFAGVDYPSFSRSYAEHLRERAASAAPGTEPKTSLQERLEQARFLVDQMASGQLLTTDLRPGARITVDQIHEFSRQVELFEGAADAVQEAREFLVSNNVDPYFAVNTHFYAPVMQHFVETGLFDAVYGQKFKPSADGRGLALDGLLDANTKYEAVRHVMKTTGAARGAIGAITDGYGDRAFLTGIRDYGGIALGVVNRGTGHAVIKDEKRLLHFRSEGLIGPIADRDWLPGGASREVLMYGAEFLVERFAPSLQADAESLLRSIPLNRTTLVADEPMPSMPSRSFLS